MSLEKAGLSLDGLSVGDAFGEQFFLLPPEFLLSRTLPPPPWGWTDDTQMALSIVETLAVHGEIRQDKLFQLFVVRFARDPGRGYGGGAIDMLKRGAQGESWRELAPAMFGSGSYGNGSAMRVAPLGAFYAGDPALASRQAELSAEITHAHPEGRAGAMAVAAAAAISADPSPPTGLNFLGNVLEYVPDGITKQQIIRSMDIPETDLARAIEELGTGFKISAQDTVPFCLWIAAFNLDDYVEAMWRTVSGLGDCDTTCAIVGGIVAPAAPVPPDWLASRELLPDSFKLNFTS
jgi:ADP-ribosylglycohydrolase